MTTKRRCKVCDQRWVIHPRHICTPCAEQIKSPRKKHYVVNRGFDNRNHTGQPSDIDQIKRELGIK